MTFTAAPVEVAIAEVRFSSSANEVSTEHATKLQAMALEQGLKLNTMQPARQQELMVQVVGVGAPAPQVTVRASGWQYFSDDQSMTVTVMPDSIVVQVTRYERWSSSLRPALAVMLRGFGELITPELRFRLGLRYINRLVDPQAATPQAWQGRINDALMGPILDPIFGKLVASANQQLELAFGGGQGAVIRHGAFNDGASRSVSYLIDLDVFDGSTCTFDVDECLSQLQRMNRTALAMFQQATSNDFREELKPVFDTKEKEEKATRTASEED
ncbi:TIGR04255 family protein [Kitasatospora sp. NPDC048365]|uniref:TIGR04255 family protein n=1 Tax=Kitasatospora sp. NPDC048365 TaxID=3364050 RepID=UPI003722488A